MYDLSTARTKARRISRTLCCVITIYPTATPDRFELVKAGDEGPHRRLSQSVSQYYNGVRQF